MSIRLAETIAEMLRDEGYRPTLDGEDVEFKAEGTPLRYETFGEDETYARLVLVYRTPEGTAMNALCALANERNHSIKAVKTTIDTDGVWFTVEQFFDEPEHLRPVLNRAIAAMRSVSEEFFAKFSEVEDASDPQQAL